MYDNLIFCNDCHNGDIHYSREFVKDIMSKVPAQNYLYAQVPGQSKAEVIKDIHNLTSIPYIRGFHLQYEPLKLIKNDMFISTWVGLESAYYIGYSEARMEGGCTLLANYELYKNTYKGLEIEIEDDMNYYIPSVDFNKVDKDKIDQFINKHNKKRILICNNKVLSGQSTNYDMNQVVMMLSAEYQDYDFILTNKYSVLQSPNVFYIEDIVQSPICDLLEISYMSTFCDIIVGRGSGPFAFTILKDNDIEDKVFIGTGRLKKYDTLWYESSKAIQEYVQEDNNINNNLYNTIKRNIKL